MFSLLEWRKARGISAAALAKELETSQPTVSRIERGEFFPSGDLITRIEAFTKGEVTANDIMETYRARQADPPSPDDSKDDTQKVSA